METRKILRRLLLTVFILIAAVIVAGLGFWLIDGRSPQAFIVSHALKKTTMEDYQRLKGDPTDKSTIEIPENVVFPREVTQYKVGDMQVFESPAQDDTKPILLYIHGGAYFLNFSPLHWSAMAEWAETTGCGIVAPNYPMLYQYTAKDAHPLMMQLYRQLLERFPAQRIIIAGDSAGGGFTLALTQEMRADSIDLPCHLILMSPWVDVTGGDDALQEHDTFLDNEVLRHVGADWAAELDTHGPIVSPFYGDMQGLPPTELFTGTWEVFYTDIVKTYNKMKTAGVDVRLHVKEKMGHVYPLWPCPEGKQARKEIAEIITLTSNT
jgi:acetyl esterase/lipase